MMKKIEDLTIYPGESHFVTLTYKVNGVATPMPATMTAAFSLKDDDGVEVSSGVGAKYGGDTQFKVGPTGTNTATLEKGSYTLTVQISDSADGFSKFPYEAKIKII
jgi:hypothetical protein